MILCYILQIPTGKKTAKKRKRQLEVYCSRHEGINSRATESRCHGSCRPSSQLAWPEIGAPLRSGQVIADLTTCKCKSSHTKHPSFHCNNFTHPLQTRQSSCCEITDLPSLGTSVRIHSVQRHKAERRNAFL
jgi:hypothetical protein